MRKKTSLSPRDFTALSDPTGNVYESVCIIAKRAKGIATTSKQELSAKLIEFSSPSDDLEEVFENQDQIALSKFYEKQPKPILVATEEFLEDKLMHRYPEEEEKPGEGLNL